VDSTSSVRQEFESLMARSTCAKLAIAALVIKDGRIIGRGFNMCAPDGTQYGERVDVCPRAALPSGTGYELCRPQHAERQAIGDAVSAFGENACEGATIIISGHYWACDGCREAIERAKIVCIEFDPHGADRAKKLYRVSEREQQ